MTLLIVSLLLFAIFCCGGVAALVLKQFQHAMNEIHDRDH